ncbi:transposase, partial [Rhizobium johnstonii]|uniref:transposase n=1 Tax=Rhizobium johnstonii TaxID=3019933 RepID=UPI003F977D12
RKPEPCRSAVPGRDGNEPAARGHPLQHAYNRIAYKQRWGIESFFAKIKQWRRLATRYDKLEANFLGFIKLASIMLWLK